MSNSFVQKYLKFKNLVREIYEDDVEKVYSKRVKYDETITYQDAKEFDIIYMIYDVLQDLSVNEFEEMLENKITYLEQNKESMKEKQKKLRNLEENSCEEYKIIKNYLISENHPIFNNYHDLVDIMKGYIKSLDKEKLESYANKYNVICNFKPKKVKMITEKLVQSLSEAEVRLLFKAPQVNL